jgi:hypothetical protein
VEDEEEEDTAASETSAKEELDAATDKARADEDMANAEDAVATDVVIACTDSVLEFLAWSPSIWDASSSIEVLLVEAASRKLRDTEVGSVSSLFRTMWRTI